MFGLKCIFFIIFRVSGLAEVPYVVSKSNMHSELRWSYEEK